MPSSAQTASTTPGPSTPTSPTPLPPPSTTQATPRSYVLQLPVAHPSHPIHLPTHIHHAYQTHHTTQLYSGFRSFNTSHANAQHYVHYLADVAAESDFEFAFRVEDDYANAVRFFPFPGLTSIFLKYCVLALS